MRPSTSLPRGDTISTATLAFGPPTLIDQVFRRRLGGDILLIAAGAALTSIFAYALVPFWPVSVTLQTLIIFLVGSALGPLRGVLAMVLYVAVGMAGLPVFPEGAPSNPMENPFGGYLIGAIPAAAAAGWLAQRGWDRSGLGSVAGYLITTAISYLAGFPWLFATMNANGAELFSDFTDYATPLQAALAMGLYPYILGNLLKALLAGILLPLAWKRLDRVSTRQDPPRRSYP